ncbi:MULTISPECIES: hypothetical protein [Aerococcus]|uniref:hypothetical protein n=1 Tax=Aerococcus TaxID=1375 RepID=UPI0018A78561|nr:MULTISPECIES: hypothetical protein [Aerococcus]MCY3067604.1 hypothetical protein [Aerococcus mictus]MCY3080494.1 hypothetical protein [Aerococcus mictus]MDK8484557.1 hypothetical protein [Aerococcus urinae]
MNWEYPYEDNKQDSIKEDEEVVKVYNILTRNIEVLEEENQKLKEQINEQLEKEKSVRNELIVIKDFINHLLYFLNKSSK